MPSTNKSTRLDFSKQIAVSAESGFNFLRTLGGLAYDYSDLFAAELTNADYAGTALEGMDKADIGAAIQGFLTITATLDANDGAYRKAFKRLAQFAK